MRNRSLFTICWVFLLCLIVTSSVYADVDLNVPLWSQTDSQWSAKKLGTSKWTMGDSGCAVTSTAMVFAYFGLNTNPGNFVDALNALSPVGIDGSGYIQWGRTCNVPGASDRHISYEGNVAKDYTRIDQELTAGYPVIMQVTYQYTYIDDKGITQPATGTHYVVIHGKANGTYYINDPIPNWSGGARTTLNSYSESNRKSIYIYHGDTTPPIIAASIIWSSTLQENLWYNTEQRLTYTVTGTTPVVNEWPNIGDINNHEIYISEAGLGMNTYWATAKNSANGTDTPTVSFRCGWDNQAPTLSPSAPATDTWLKSAQQISWTATDAHSDMQKVTIIWDGVESGPVGSPQNIPEGIHTATLKAYDNAGNVATANLGTFYIDTGIPIITPSTPATNVWLKAPQQVSWTASDSISGIQKATIQWDGDAESGAVSSPQVIPPGTHSAVLRAYDNAGNVTIPPINIGTFKVDNDIPVLYVTPLSVTTWLPASASLSWTSTDGLSGVNRVTIQTDNGAEQTFPQNGSMTLLEGKHTYSLKVYDNVGNESASQPTGEIWIDSTPPQVSASLTTPPTGDNEWYLLPASLYMDATDTVSGIATLQYRIDGGEWITYNPSNVLTGDGKHIIECRATDVAGNVSAIVTLVYNLDTTPPGIPVVTVSPESASTSILSASWYSTEPHSGIAEYDFAIGTSQGGTDIVARRANDNRPYAYVMNLNLAIGGKYYFTVWAKNGAGTWAIDAGFSTAITVVNGNSLDGPGGLFSAGGTGDIPQQDIRSTGGKSLVDKMGSFVVFNSLSENFEILHGVDERLDGDYSAPTPIGEPGSNRIRTSANYAICDVLGLFVVGSSTNGTATIQHGYFAPLGGLAGVTLTADTASPVDKGKTVRFTATVSGGTVLEYQFVVVTYPGGVATYPSPMPAYQPSNTFDWTPIADGKHTIIVYAREKGTTFPVQYAKSIYDVKTTLSAVVLTSNLTSPVTVGKTVIFTATATGGAVVEYQFKEGDNVLRDFSADKSYQVTGAVGTHTITVVARDIHGVDPVATVTFSKSFTVNPTLSDVALTTNPANAVLLGRSITLIATPTGGSNLQYKFMYGTLVLRDFASSNSYVWTPSTLKTYTNLTVVAKDTGGIDSSATVTSPGIAISTKKTTTEVSLTSNPANVALFGTSVTFTATTVGGVNPQYKFMYGTIMLRDFASSNTYTWTPGAVKTYSGITVVVKDSGGVDPLATFTSPPISITTKLALTAITLATSPVNTVLLGNSVTLTATATGGVNLQYKFMYGSTILRDFAAGNILVWKPGALKTYSGITVVVKDLGGADPTATMTSNAVSITTKAALTGISMTTSPLNAVLLGKPVTLTATATGGVNLQYKFMYGTLILRDFAVSNTMNWTPGALKTYSGLTVVVKDLGGVDPTLTLTSLPVSITTKTALTGVTLATAPVNTCVVGSQVTLTATATAGVSVMYKFMTGTTIIRDFNSSNTCIWTPNAVAIHSLTVIAKDTGGTDPLATVTSPAKTFTVTGPLAPLTVVSVAALPTTVTLGSQVTLTATAIGGATVQYKFMYGILTLRDFAAGNSYTFNPSTAKTYSGITVTAKDTGGVDPLATVVSPATSFVVVK